MIDKIKNLCVKYREIIVYVIVGGLTTVVNWGCFYLLTKVLDSDVAWQLSVNNTVSWLLAVLFAYPLNRRWVFRSTNPRIFKEFMGFTASRVSTWIIELVIMWLCVNVIGINEFVSKYLIASVIVVILNYVFSKLLVFKKKEPDAEEAPETAEE